MRTTISTLSALLLALPWVALAQEDEPPDDLEVPAAGTLEDLLEGEPEDDLSALERLLGDDLEDPWATLEEPLEDSLEDPWGPLPDPPDEQPVPSTDPFAELDALVDDAPPAIAPPDEESWTFDPVALVQGSRIGGRLGLGAPARGTTATLALGAQWRIPDVVPDLVDVQLDLGWYFIGTHKDLAQQDPYGGAGQVEVDFTTHVFPLELSGVVRPPLDLSFMPVPTQAYAGLGVHLSGVYRHDEAPASGLAVGTQLFLGADLGDLGPGTLSPTLSWMGARRALGRIGVDGDPTRETVANLRLNLAYTLPF